MSTQMKLIIPLLDEGLSKDLLSPEAGFIEAYNSDINNPNLDNHIFLVYDGDLSIPGNYYRNERMMKMKNLYQRHTVHIKGFLLMIYIFCIMCPSIRHIIKGNIILNDKSKLNIFRFWGTDEDVYMAIATNAQFDVLSAMVPEQDRQLSQTTNKGLIRLYS